MNITGIICEYNPLHLGHKKQLDILRAQKPEDGIVCLMSGNFVQRGAPAVFDKMHRAKAAISCGADLVLELPVTAALSSAEGFAAVGVKILSPFCDWLCFGAETADTDSLIKIARCLLRDEFIQRLKLELETGLSFPAARQAALDKMGLEGSLLSQPNNILAVEYCKAILSQNSAMKPYVIHRQGGYHDTLPDKENPSATALRDLIQKSGNWQAFVPEEAAACFADAPIHTLQAGERAILGKLRTMTEEEFSQVPFGSEGLWRKLMRAARTENTLEDIIHATKSKRYTRTRIDRMIVCAFLGITEETLSSPAPYVRVLALNDKGREILKKAKETGTFINIGEKQADEYQLLENRCSSLYGLFATTPEDPDMESKYRIYYKK